MRDLEELVERLEHGDLPLEESLAAFERGVMLTRACQSALKEAEQKVEILLKKAGEPAVEDFTARRTQYRLIRAVTADAMEARLRGYQSRVQAVLDAAFPAADLVPQRLHAAQRYAVLGGGKRLRPLLVYCTGEALRMEPAIGCARRGGRTHSLYTPWFTTICRPWTTMICGAASPRRTAHLMKRPPSSRAMRFRSWRSHCCRAIARRAERRSASENDSDSRRSERHRGHGRRPSFGPRRGRQDLELDDLEAMHRLKTGALIRASVLLAAACAPT